MAKDFITVGKSIKQSHTLARRVSTTIPEDNPIFKRIKEFANPFGTITYTSKYDTSNKELIFDFNPRTIGGNSRVAMPSKTGNYSKTYTLNFYINSNRTYGGIFKTATRCPTSNCFFQEYELHIQLINSINASTDTPHKEQANLNAETKAIVEELAKQLEPTIQQAAKEIITGLINSDGFATKLANAVAFKQGLQLSTKFNRMMDQNQTANRQLKEDISKKLAQSVEQLIKFWNK